MYSYSPNKSKQTPSPKLNIFKLKIMATAFWNCSEILLTEFIELCITIKWEIEKLSISTQNKQWGCLLRLLFFCTIILGPTLQFALLLYLLSSNARLLNNLLTVQTWHQVTTTLSSRWNWLGHQDETMAGYTWQCRSSTRDS